MKPQKPLLLFAFLLLHVIPVQAADPISEIIRQGIIRVIRATDLQVQRLQNESILLQNAQKLLENKLTEWKLDEISDWGIRQKDLFDNHYQSLRNVKQAVSDIQQVGAMLRHQQHIMAAYRDAWRTINTSEYFRQEEKNLLNRIYADMIAGSARDTDKMLSLLQDGFAQMEDASRIKAIMELESGLAKKAIEIQRFNRANLELLDYRKNTFLETYKF